MASWAYIHWGCPDFMGANMLPLAESESHSCGMPKPITPAKPEWEIFKALDASLPEHLFTTSAIFEEYVCAISSAGLSAMIFFSS